MQSNKHINVQAHIIGLCGRYSVQFGRGGA